MPRQPRPVAEPHSFWTWFQENEASIRRAYETGDGDALDALLSKRVAEAAGGAGWEIGPYALPLNALVISPARRDRVRVCRALVERAPSVSGWRFYAGKPPKELRSLTIVVSGHEVCADRWRYRLTSYADGAFVDLELFFEECDSPGPADPDLTCELLVEALIGELASLERVGYIHHACVPDVEAVERSTPLRLLKEHLSEVLSPQH
jgi:hypothetical protein